MKIQKIKIDNNIIKTYDHMYSIFLNLKPSKLEFNLKTMERELEHIEINVEYCIVVLDMTSTVHNAFLFQYNKYKYKNKLINKIYTKIHKTIYDSEGNQKDNFKAHFFKDLSGSYEYNNSMYLYLIIKKL